MALDMTTHPIIIALDFPDLPATQDFLRLFGREKLFVKVGMELFYKEGERILSDLRSQGHRIFLDLKLHDIPHTVERTMRQLTKWEVDLVTVHASGGEAMMRAAMRGLQDGSHGHRPRCLGVTQLTSQPATMSGAADLAVAAHQSGLDGVVSSVADAATIRQRIKTPFLIVSPGIRLPEDETQDQQRVATPQEAFAAGVDHIVVGRPITQSPKPARKYAAWQTFFASEEQTADRVVRELLQIGALATDTVKGFTWASGIQSPIYCDHRQLCGYPQLRTWIATQLVALIHKHYPDVDVIAGTATAAIPHAAWVADLMAKPMVYVRSTPKTHGKTNHIEGVTPAGKKVVVIEDVISSGGSALQSVEALRTAGATVLGIAAIFNYESRQAAARFHQQHIPIHQLTHFTALLRVLKENDHVMPDLDKVRGWHQQWISIDHEGSIL